jgi:hypothetical protein
LATHLTARVAFDRSNTGAPRARRPGAIQMNNETDKTAVTGSGNAPSVSEQKTYSAPAMERCIEGWPFGRFERCTAVFKIEQHPTRGERAVRTIIDAQGHSYAPKKLTFARLVRIVEGSDGRTYIAELTRSGFVSIMQSNMKFEEESIFERDPRYAAVRALFDGGAVK